MRETGIRRCLVITACMFLLVSFCLSGALHSVSAAGVSASKVRKQADKIIKKQTKKISKKDKAARLDRILRYADGSYSYRPLADKPFIQASLEKQMSDKNLRSAAYTMLKKRKGTCFHEAAALAYLIRRATGYPTQMVIGQTDAFSGNMQPHAWVEALADGYWRVFDSNLDRAKGGSMAWFGIPTDGSDQRYSHYKPVWRKDVK